ncbi:helix-turn-helix domain-containing protein [Aerococcaceae bacterium NML190073]|nr:helix-turn-helix domain-containing protein [Aerococcaceae bacterium NML190073]
MKMLLSKSQQRQLEIIEVLYEKKEFVHLKELAELVKASERVIINDLSTIKSTFEKLDIQTSIKGVILRTNATIGIDGVYRYYLENSLNFRVLEYIFFNPGVSVIDASESLYISVSSFYRAIEKINKAIIQLFHFKVVGGQLRIEGDERDIRYFFAQYFSEKCETLAWPFVYLDERIFSEILLYFSNFSKIPQDFARFRFFKYVVAVNYYRTVQGNTLSIDSAYSKELYERIKQSENFNEIITGYSQKLGIALNFKTLEQLFAGFVRKDFYFSYEQLLADVSIHRHVASSVQLLKKFLMNLLADFGIRLTNYEDLILHLHNTSHLDKFEIESYFILHNKKKRVIKVLETYYPNFYKKVVEGLTEYRLKVHGECNEYIINHLVYTLFSHWDHLFNELYSKLPVIKALVISDFDLPHAKAICDTFNYYMNEQLLAEPFTEEVLNLDELVNSEYDIIVSTFELPTQDLEYYLYVDKIVEASTVQKLREIVEEISLKKRNI